MEVLLHESSANGNCRVVPSESNGVPVREPAVNHIIVNPEKVPCNRDVQFSRLPQQQPVDIQFKDITYTATEGAFFKTKSEKQILHKVNGRFPPGKLIAIMGPSGAGKSTLLDVLTGYRIRGVGGAVYVNGISRNLKEFRKMSCYITQDDRLQGLLTVQENMEIAADLKLSTDMSKREKKEIINEILQTLGLSQNKQTRTAGLSGGQKKRLSIALELISNPLIMFLDEPTTGLDSSSCSTCLKLLGDLASHGRTIVCTIHQPSASLFQLFDQVYVLSAGYCLYQGSAENIVPFMENTGCPCPHYHNPADHVIEVACGEYGKDHITNMIDAARNGSSLEYFTDPSHLPAVHLLRDNQKNDASDEELLATSQFNQLNVLLRRGVIKTKRDQTLTYLRVAVNIVVGIMLGTLYWQAGKDGARVLDNYNLLFSILMHHMMSTMMLTILTFPTEMGILIKEHFNRWYSLKMYYTSITLIDIPLTTFCCFIFTVIVYTMTGQPLETVRFNMFFVSNLLVVFVAQGFGLMIGAYFDVVNGTFLGPTLSIPMMMFAGFGVRLRDLPNYMYWGSYISYLRFGLEGVVGAVYGLNRGILDCAEDAYCHYRYPKKLLEDVDMRSDQFDNDVVVLLIFLFVLRIAAYVILRIKLIAVR